ncbi:MAG: hypothetical protein E6R03_16235 [Hyphomicrobiaceae bacterium]|nr:MAG: hypothetical protein E6R03_16235 [Hyphomicrobiaceae bacterium]
MKVQRDLQRLKPTSMTVLGQVIDQETIDSIYESRAAFQETYGKQIVETLERYGKLNFHDVMKRIEWAYDPLDLSRAKESAHDVIMWFNLFRPLEGSGIYHYIDLNKMNAVTNFNEDAAFGREFSMFVLQTPTQVVYDLMRDKTMRQTYLDWAIFMAMTSDHQEIRTYAQREFGNSA